MPMAKNLRIIMGAKAAIGSACGLLVIALIFMAIFTLRRKRKAKELIERVDPLGNDLLPPSQNINIFLIKTGIKEYVKSIREILWLVEKREYM